MNSCIGGSAIRRRWSIRICDPVTNAISFAEASIPIRRITNPNTLYRRRIANPTGQNNALQNFKKKGVRKLFNHTISNIALYFI